LKTHFDMVVGTQKGGLHGRIKQKTRRGIHSDCHVAGQIG